MDFAIACPCTGPRATVCRIRRSRVPCRSPSWSSVSLVDIRPELNPGLVECQGECKVNYRESTNSDSAYTDRPGPCNWSEQSIALIQSRPSRYSGFRAVKSPARKLLLEQHLAGLFTEW